MPSKRQPLLLFVLFWGLTALLYRNSFGGQFYDDFITGILAFKDFGWGGFANSYGFSSLYYGHNLFFLGFYDFFGLSSTAWFLLFTSLHSLNAVLGFAFLKRIFTKHNFAQATSTALLCSLMFLVSPYQAENVIWAGTLHYLVSMVFMWGIIFLYTSYLDGGGKWRLWATYFLFAFSLVTLEIALVFPIVFLLVFGLLWQPVSGTTYIWRHLKTLLMPMLLIIGVYLVATFWLKGHYIGHYGSDAHLNLKIPKILSNFWRYWFKLLGFTHYWPLGIRSEVYNRLEHHIFSYGFLAPLVLGLVALFRHSRARGWFALGWVGIVFITLFPVLNMVFVFLHSGENDRLSYFPSLFIFAAPVILFSWFAPRYVWVYGLAVLVLNLGFLQSQNTMWRNAAIVHERAMDSPHFYGNGRAYLLNLPCYYGGVYAYRTPLRLHWARHFYDLPLLDKNLRFPLASAMQSPADSVIVTALSGSSNTFEITYTNPINRFWQNAHPAYSRTDNGMVITLGEEGYSYTLEITDLKPEDRLLYFTFSGWQVFPRQTDKDSTSTISTPYLGSN